MRRQSGGRSDEERFRAVFSHRGAVMAYAQRRGSGDADGIAAEVMTIAWRRLHDVPADDPRPWLYATAKNLLMAEARRAARERRAATMPEPVVAAPEVSEIDPGLWRALVALSPLDRESLLLIAWEELTPAQAARALGINPAAFRVRLLRARRRMRTELERGSSEGALPAPLAQLDPEGTR